MRVKQLIPPRTGDREVDMYLAQLREAVEEMQRSDLAYHRLIEDVDLADATTVKVKHGLGRKYRAFFLSPPVGPSTSGRIEEIEPTDPTQELWLEANGYGATVTVDVLVLG